MWVNAEDFDNCTSVIAPWVTLRNAVHGGMSEACHDRRHSKVYSRSSLYLCSPENNHSSIGNRERMRSNAEILGDINGAISLASLFNRIILQ